METRKITFVLIIVLLIIFLPLTVIGTTLHLKKSPLEEATPNQELKQDGKLHFYDNGVLLGTYTCEQKDYCDYATLRNTYPYDLDEYQPSNETKTELINNRYAFLMDSTTENLINAEIILYDVTTEKVIGRYKEIKNYEIGIESNSYLVKNTNDKWGVIEFYDGVNLKIPFKYDYIGLANRINPETQKIIADTYAVLDEQGWRLVNNNEKDLTPITSDEIISYNSNAIISKNTEGMQIKNYEGKPLLNGTYQNINFYNKYITIIDKTNHFYLYDLAKQRKVSKEYNVEKPEDVVLKTEQDSLIITIKGELVETIAIL